MKLVDLTHIISEKMPVYPGTETPTLGAANSYEKDGFKETLMTMYSHTGTHMDPPAHVRPEGKTLDQMDLSSFIGKAIVVDCSDLKEGDLINMSYIDRNREKIDQAEFVLFSSRWSRYWGQERYYGEFPVADEEVIHYLVDTGKKGIGMDAISIEPISAETLPHHHIILGSGMVIIENLTNLELLGDDLFTLFALPLKWENADGSPIRAVAVL